MTTYPDFEEDPKKLKAQELLKKIEPLYKAQTPPPLEEAENFTFLSQHYTMTYLSETLGVSRSYITTRISLMNLIPELHNLLRNERLGFWEAYQMSKSSPEEQREALKGLEEKENVSK
jgi:hypothetical protein